MPFGGSPRLTAPFLSIFLLTAARPAGAEDATARTTAPTQAYAIHIASESTARTLREVLDGAAARLKAPECRGILDDFRDGAGHPLRARLEATGESPEGYLDLIVFYDGAGNVRCHRKGILAAAAVGSRAVYICPEEFVTMAHRRPRWTEATLIHEALHTLGLGENPPSSTEITERVIRRCQP